MDTLLAILGTILTVFGLSGLFAAAWLVSDATRRRAIFPGSSGRAPISGTVQIGGLAGGALCAWPAISNPPTAASKARMP